MAGPPLLSPPLGLVAIRVLGIDEAGRGALLGPLVVAGVLVEGRNLRRLRAKGATDSKAVPRDKRKALLAELLPLAAGARTRVVTPREIDRESLTQLELSAAITLIRGLCPDLVVLDAPVHPRAIPNFRAKLIEALRRSFPGSPPRVVIAPKADRDHPVVGTASILAKVTRDAYVEWLRRRFGDFGWGYPGEPAAREFLRAWWERHRALPPICRRKWSTVREVLGLRLEL